MNLNTGSSSAGVKSFSVDDILRPSPATHPAAVSAATTVIPPALRVPLLYSSHHVPPIVRPHHVNPFVAAAAADYHYKCQSSAFLRQQSYLHHQSQAGKNDGEEFEEQLEFVRPCE